MIDRDTASRLGSGGPDIDNALYDAFGQRQVSTMYRPLKQYHVVMEVAPQFQQTTEALQNIYLRSATGAHTACARSRISSVQHTAGGEPPSQFPSVTISFNLAPGVSLGEATTASKSAQNSIGFPTTIQRQLPGDGGCV